MRYVFLIATATWVLAACNNNSQNERTRELRDREAIGCSPTQTTDKEWYTSGKKALLFDGLSGINFNISTRNKEAQKYFNQGMMLAYGFNHAEAARSFYEVTKLDSTCAMGYWGLAYVLGPNYNGGMEEDNFQRAYAAALKARTLSQNASSKEKALIDALTSRYEAQPPQDRKPLDIAYAAAMKKVYALFPEDADIGSMYAESLMDIHPWDLYDKKTKKARAWTPEIIHVLEAILKFAPKHAGANHFYVHALEASATPEKALLSAKLLDTLVPGAGHLVHMPSHIYINTGDYHEGSLANIHSVRVDSIYTVACHAQGIYPIAYAPHNYHFLAATATLEGNSALAWATAKALQKHTANDIMRSPQWATLQHYFTIPYHIAVKFRMWDTILTLRAPEVDMKYPRLMWHYARGMAYSGKNDLNNAQAELDSLKSISADPELQKLTVWNINSIADLSHIAVKVLSGSLSLQRGQVDDAVSALKEAVVLEDNLNYDEPPDWFFSVRHYLGAAQLQGKKYAEAEITFRGDLKIWRKNGWALHGLYNSLRLQNKEKDAKNVKSEFDKAWRWADFKLD